MYMRITALLKRTQIGDNSEEPQYELLPSNLGHDEKILLKRNHKLSCSYLYFQFESAK